MHEGSSLSRGNGDDKAVIEMSSIAPNDSGNVPFDVGQSHKLYKRRFAGLFGLVSFALNV